MAFSQGTQQCGQKNYKGTAKEENDAEEEETTAMREDRINKYKTAGDAHFKDDGRIAEITFTLVLRARVEMAEEKVNGPRDSMVFVEMITELPQNKFTKLQGTFHHAS